MKNILLAVSTLVVLASVASAQPTPFYNPLAVDIARGLLKNVFETNATPFIQPMVNTINATSNTRFYTNAYIPSETDKPYVRVSANGMVGYISEGQILSLLSEYILKVTLKRLQILWQIRLLVTLKS